MAAFLMVIGAIIIIISIVLNKKENKYKFSRTLKNTDSNITDSDVRIGELKKEFAESLLEIQESVQKLEDRLDILEQKKISETDVSSRNIEDIRKLIKEGKTLDEIADELKIGKGELLLIKDLYLK